VLRETIERQLKTILCHEPNRSTQLTIPSGNILL
jgi:hypothetical protein